jgi:hypothetical protein
LSADQRFASVLTIDRSVSSATIATICPKSAIRVASIAGRHVT